MNRCLFISFICSLSFLLSATGSDKPENVMPLEINTQAPVTEDISETSELASIVELSKDDDIPVPEITPPSDFMAWVRSVGISLLYKYYAFKEWLWGSPKNAENEQNEIG